MTVLQYFHHLDQNLTLAVNSWSVPALDPVWQTFSAIKIWYPMYALVAAFIIWRLGWKKGGIVILSCILTVVCCDQLSNFTKAAVQRLRPCWDGNMLTGGLRILEDKGGLYGFYSSHAANTLGFALCTYWGLKNDSRLKYRGYAAVFCSWAFLVGISRVFVGKHFLGDVFVGFAAGVFFAWIMAKAADLLIRKLGL